MPDHKKKITFIGNVASLCFQVSSLIYVGIKNDATFFRGLSDITLWRQQFVFTRSKESWCGYDVNEYGNSSWLCGEPDAEKAAAVLREGISIPLRKIVFAVISICIGLEALHLLYNLKKKKQRKRSTHHHGEDAKDDKTTEDVVSLTSILEHFMVWLELASLAPILFLLLLIISGNRSVNDLSESYCLMWCAMTLLYSTRSIENIEASEGHIQKKKKFLSYFCFVLSVIPYACAWTNFIYYIEGNGELHMHEDTLVVGASLFVTLTSYWILQLIFFCKKKKQQTETDAQQMSYLVVTLLIKSIVMSLTLNNVHKHGHIEHTLGGAFH